MKKSLVARGFVGAVASLLGVAAVGCGADVGDGAAGDSAEIGSVAEALTTSGNAKADIEFFGSIKLDSAILNSNGHADNLELIAGGMIANGTAQVHIQVYDRETDTLTRLRDTSPADLSLTTALVEPVIAKIPNTNNAYLIAGGRTVRDGAVSTDSYVVKLNLNGASKIASASLFKIAGPNGTVLPAGVVFTHKSIKQCGAAANQQLIAFGGVDAAKSFQDMSGKSATRNIAVFTYDAASPANSDWALLKDNTAGTPRTVRLREANGRGYYEVLNATDTDFFIAGGLNSGANALATVDYVKVSSSCVASTADVDADGTGFAKAKEGTAMPAAAARMASIRVEPYAITVNNVTTTYDFVVAGGNGATIANGTALPVTTYQFDPDTTTSCGAGCTTQGVWSTISTNIQAGRVFPRFVAVNQSGSTVGLDGVNLPTVVKLVTGIEPQAGSEATNEYYQTSVLNDVFTRTATTGAWTVGTAFSSSNPADDRAGVFADLLKNNATLDPVVGLGGQHTATGGNNNVNSTAELANVISVP